MADLFADATWQIDPDTELHGADAVRGWLEDNLIVHGGKLGTRHIISNLITDVADDGQSATSTSYVHVTQVTVDFPLQLISQASYLDRFVKDARGSRFERRDVLSDGAGDMRAHRRSL